VNVLGEMQSLYAWEGTVEDEIERQIVIKTTRDRFAALEREIKARSRYELPEVLAVRVDGGSAEYLSWVEACVAT